LHNAKLRFFCPKNTISWAGVWWLTGYVVAGLNRPKRCFSGYLRWENCNEFQGRLEPEF
jgi:hypothetical protein